MLRIAERALETAAQACDTGGATLTLPFELRQRSRLRARLDDGREAALTLERGERLRGGDVLRTTDGELVRVVAAPEQVSTIATTDPTALLRACYHLANRHVALQIGDGFVRYLADHVLDDMVAKLGLSATREEQPFEPEPGAYHSHGPQPDPGEERPHGRGSGHGHTHGHHGHGPGDGHAH